VHFNLKFCLKVSYLLKSPSSCGLSAITELLVLSNRNTFLKQQQGTGYSVIDFVRLRSELKKIVLEVEVAHVPRCCIAGEANGHIIR